MRRIAISMIICTICANAHATTPFSPKVFSNDSWAFVAAFAWPDENDKVLIIRTVRRTSLLSLEDLGIEQIREWSSAGSMWYQQSIGYVTSLQIKGMDTESRLRVFYFRDKHGKESIVDLNANKLIAPSEILNRDELDKKTGAYAASLLQSDRPQDRQAAAIHLGQLKSQEHLQALTKLLDDDASYTQISGSETKTVYFVKEAAEKAIQLINTKGTANNRLNPISGSSIKLPEKD